MWLSNNNGSDSNNDNDNNNNKYNDNVKMSQAVSKDTLLNIVRLGFITDSIALGSHWVYDSKQIQDKLGRADKIVKPTIARWHSMKEAGDFTSYGDTALFLLESIAENGGKFDQGKYGDYFVKKWTSHNAYKDTATRGTLANHAAGKKTGAHHDDIGAISSYFPIIALGYKDEDSFSNAARSAVQASQDHADTLATTEFFARTFYRVLYNKTHPVEALKAVAKQLNNKFISHSLEQGLASASAGKDERDPGTKSCHIEVSVPVTIHFIAKYADLKDVSALDATVENLQIGGENAGRAGPIITILAAYKGPVFSQDLYKQVKKHQHIDELLAKL